MLLQNCVAKRAKMVFLYISIDILPFYSIFLNPEEVESTAQLLLFAKIFLKINGKFAVIIGKCYKESHSYFGENLKKFGKNFIKIINNVVKIEEILEKQWICNNSMKI